MYHFFFSIINLALALFFIIFGVIAVIIPWDPATRTTVITFILENSIAIMLFGFGFALVGIAMMVNFFQNLKRHHLTIQSTTRPVSIDPIVIQDYVSAYLKKSFPTRDIPHRVALKNNRIYIFAELPKMAKAEQKSTLDTVRKELSDLFVRFLGYHHEFNLSVSFKNG